MAEWLLTQSASMAIRKGHAISVVGGLPWGGPVLEQEHRCEAAIDGPRRLHGRRASVSACYHARCCDSLIKADER